jgi:hypothetical protein
MWENGLMESDFTHIIWHVYDATHTSLRDILNSSGLKGSVWFYIVSGTCHGKYRYFVDGVES